MSEFVDRMAEVSEGSEDEEVREELKKRKKGKSKSKQFIEDSEESNDDEDEDDMDADALRQEMADLIDDNEEEDDQGSNAGSDGKRSREDDDDLEEDLDEEDLELLEENLGYKVPRKKKLKRVRIDDDDEEDGGGNNQDEQNEREMIANELFDDDDDEQPTQAQPRREERDLEDRFARISDEESEESDENDFIVDDDDQPIRKKNKKRSSHRYADEAFQQAQEIFGVDFDFEDLQDDYDEYGMGSEEEEEEDEEEISEEDENGERVTRIVKRSGKKSKRRGASKSIFELYEPVELEKGHLTEKDEEIRKADVPERFQVRQIPVTPCEEDELIEEAQWIYKNAFNTPTISIQSTEMGEVKRDPVAGGKDPQSIPKIAAALRNIRNHLLEVPFIAFYRKEHIEPDLGSSETGVSELMESLWHIYHWDEKWCQLQERKKNLVSLFKQMQGYLREKIERDADPERMAQMYREITEQDIERVQEVKNFDELRDCWVQFQLYYAAEVEPMKEEQKQRDRQRRIDEALGDQAQIDRILAEEHEDIRRRLDKMKVVPRKDTYTVCKEAGILGFASQFGLAPEQFGENLRDNYQRHEVQQCQIDPYTLASEYRTNRFQKEEVIIQAAKFMVAKQLSCDPLVRKVLRQVYFERARVKARPTKKGKKEIDENHPCFTYKYLINKPVTELAKDQFLNLMTAQKEGLMEVRISVDPESPTGELTQTYFDEIKSLYYRDEYASHVEQWNKLREDALKLSLEKFLYPSLEKELKSKLLHEVQQEQTKAACRKLREWIGCAPYEPDPLLTDFEDFDARDGVRIMGFAFSPTNEFPAYAAMIDGEGEVTNHLRLPYFMLKIFGEAYATDQERDLRNKDRRRLKDFLYENKPHAIVVGADNVVTRKVKEDLEKLLREVYDEDTNFPAGIPVEIMPNDLAGVYMNSKKAQQDFHDVNAPLLRQAVSLARRLQDPLIEFSQLCTSEEELLCLKFCDFQDQIPKDELLTWLYQEFVNRVNEVGVDVNRAMSHPHTANLLQFVGGFGPRKAAAFYRTLKKKSTPLLESRTQLVTDLSLGAKIFINCAGFIKIDVAQLQAAANEAGMEYIEILDSTRVHPEAYEWARKMAVDALEYDEDNHDENQASAIEEIMENPDKLKDLDLDAFAEELDRQGFGRRHITLYDIRNELTHRYRDKRRPYTSPTDEDIFQLLTKETPKTFYNGKLVIGQVIGIYRKRPTEKELNDQDINPVRNEDGTWSCPYCKRADFAELNEVWSHFDTQECQGQALGVRIRLDNGIVGLCETKNLSDKEVQDPEDRVQVGMTVHARVTRIFPEKFACNLTCKSSDLNDKFNTWRPPKDVCYDYEAEDEDIRKEEDQKKKQQKQPYFKRIIVHPSFHNIDFKGAEKMLAGMTQGEAIIRPSSKGTDHLTLTWKVHEGINQHVDVKEEQKDNAFSLGHQLFIHGEAYEDLDEIIARYVNPMSANARELLNYKYFVDAEGGKRDIMERLLMEEKRKAPNKIHYFVSASKDLPGKFILSYLPRNTVRHEYITITPEGFRYRQQLFRSVNQLIRWFKEHFREPPPQTPRPTPGQVRTPGSFLGTPIDPNAIRRAASSLTSETLNTLARATGQSNQTPRGYGLTGTPNAAQAYGGQYGGYPAGSTPQLTPGYGASGTPRNFQATPSQQNWASGSMGPPSSRAPVSRPATSGNTPRQNASGAAWGNMAREWQYGGSRTTPRGTPGTSGYNSKTPLYATPGASSHMSISPTQTPNMRNDTPMNDEWGM